MIRGKLIKPLKRAALSEIDETDEWIKLETFLPKIGAHWSTTETELNSIRMQERRSKAGYKATGLAGRGLSKTLWELLSDQELSFRPEDRILR